MTDMQPTAGNQRTVLTDIDIPFGRLIAIMIKFALAAIPAAIVVWVIIFAIAMIVSGVFGIGFMRMWSMRV